MNNFWDLRYKEEGYAYGAKPNEFFKNSIDTLNQKGTLLLGIMASINWLPILFTGSKLPDGS